MAELSPTRLDVRHPATQEEVANVQDGTLWAYNVAQTGDDKLEHLVIYAFDATGAKIGGLVGTYVWGWLHIETLIVVEAARGLGIGTQLVRAAEADALSRGCTKIHLETMSWQARPFYEKLGYEVFATLEGFPKDGKQFYLRKHLSPPEPQPNAGGSVQ